MITKHLWWDLAAPTFIVVVPVDIRRECEPDGLRCSDGETDSMMPAARKENRRLAAIVQGAGRIRRSVSSINARLNSFVRLFWWANVGFFILLPAGLAMRINNVSTSFKYFVFFL
jgi:hypothetical protein